MELGRENSQESLWQLAGQTFQGGLSVQRYFRNIIGKATLHNKVIIKRFLTRSWLLKKKMVQLGSAQKTTTLIYSFFFFFCHLVFYCLICVPWFGSLGLGQENIFKRIS